MPKLILGMAVIYSGLLLLVYLYQKNLLFFPDQTPFEQCPVITNSGGVIHQAQGTRLYLIRTSGPKAKGYVLHFHGNAGRACDRYFTSKEFLNQGYHLILAEYPGYSEKAALPSEADILQSADGAYAFLVKENVENLPVILFGESLGTAPATYLASKKLKNLSALILQTPFPSIAAVGQSHYFYLPIKLLLKHQFEASKWAKGVQVPVFIFHGEEDEVIPFRLGKQQAQNFSQDLVSFWQVERAHHNDLLFIAGNELWMKIENFLYNKHK